MGSLKPFTFIRKIHSEEMFIALEVIIFTKSKNIKRDKDSLTIDDRTKGARIDRWTLTKIWLLKESRE